MGVEVIFEQAFYNLPEILVGARYLEQEYETGITGAFSMAVLQELNGRNLHNPISHIRLEHKYITPNGVSGRSIRADMFLRTNELRVANENLDAYGWRFQNFLEAKYIRDSSNQTLSRGEIAVDLVRLACLARSKPAQQDTIGRYLLHVYRGKPEDLVGGRLTQAGNPRKNYQPWLGDIRTPGVKKVVVDIPSDQVKGVTKRFPPPIDALKLEFQARNLEIVPSRTIAGVRQYWCYLTKLESARVELGNHWFEISPDRLLTESAPGKRDEIWAKVYQYLDP